MMAGVGAAGFDRSDRVVQQEVDRVQAEPIHAAIEPKATCLQQRVHHCWIMQVQRRLVTEEMVHEILPPPRLPRPGGTAEHRQPVVGWCAVRGGIGPHIPVGFCGCSGAAAVEEPWMPVGCVAPNLIDQDFQTERPGFGQQVVEIR